MAQEISTGIEGQTTQHNSHLVAVGVTPIVPVAWPLLTMAYNPNPYHKYGHFKSNRLYSKF